MEEKQVEAAVKFYEELREHMETELNKYGLDEQKRKEILDEELRDEKLLGEIEKTEKQRLAKGLGSGGRDISSADKEKDRKESLEEEMEKDFREREKEQETEREEQKEESRREERRFGEMFKNVSGNMKSAFSNLGKFAGKKTASGIGKGTKVVLKTGAVVGGRVAGGAAQLGKQAASAGAEKTKTGIQKILPADEYDIAVLVAWLIHFVDGWIFGWDYGNKSLQFLHFGFILWFWVIIRRNDQLHGNAGSVIAPILLGIAVLNGNDLMSWTIFVVVTIFFELVSEKPNDLSLLLFFAAVLWLDLFALPLLFKYVIPLSLIKASSSSPLFIIKLLTNRVLFPVLALFTMFYAYTRKKSGFTGFVVMLFILFWIMAAVPDIRGNFQASKIVTPEQKEQAMEIWKQALTTSGEIAPRPRKWFDCFMASIQAWTNPELYAGASRGDFSYDKCMAGMPLEPGRVVGEKRPYMDRVWVWDGKRWKEGELELEKAIQGSTLKDAEPFKLSFSKIEPSITDPLSTEKEYSTTLSFSVPEAEYLQSTLGLEASCKVISEGVPIPGKIYSSTFTESGQQETAAELLVIDDLLGSVPSKSLTLRCMFPEYELSGKDNNIEFKVTLKGARFRSVYRTLMTREKVLETWIKNYAKSQPADPSDLFSWFRGLYIDQVNRDPAVFDKQWPSRRVEPYYPPSGISFALEPVTFQSRPIIGLPEKDMTVTFQAGLSSKKDESLWKGINLDNDVLITFNELSLIVPKGMKPARNCRFSECSDIKGKNLQKCSYDSPELVSWDSLKSAEKLLCDFTIPADSVDTLLEFDPRSPSVKPVAFEFLVVADVSFAKKAPIKTTSESKTKQLLPALPFPSFSSPEDAQASIIDSLERGDLGVNVLLSEGTDVYSPVDGLILRTGCDSHGNVVYIKDTKTKLTHVFGHLRAVASNTQGEKLKKGDAVKAGDKIGEVGATGRPLRGNLDACFSGEKCYNNEDRCEENCYKLCVERAEDGTNQTLYNIFRLNGYSSYAQSACVERHCGIPGQAEPRRVGAVEPALYYVVLTPEGRALNPRDSLINTMRYSR